MEDNEAIIKSIIKKSNGVFTQEEINFLEKLVTNSYIKLFLILDKAIEDAYEVSKAPLTFSDDESKIRISFLKEAKELADHREYARKKLSEDDIKEVEKLKKNKSNTVAI
jgi:hypothetical protein